MAKLRSVCPLDCPDTCSVLLTVEDGRVVKLEGNPDHPVTRGFACVKTYKYPERQNHPERLDHPLRRVGAKGEGRFERVSWGEALDSVAERLREILARRGGEAVLPYSYAGTMGLVERDHPLAFFRAIGASELDWTICLRRHRQGRLGSQLWPRQAGNRPRGRAPQRPDRSVGDVVVAVGQRWPKLAPDGRSLNDLTSERLTDLGGGSTFGNCVVRVEPAPPALRLRTRTSGAAADRRRK